MQQIEQCKKILKDNGHSATRPRLRVFAALQGHSPRSLQQLLLEVNNNMDRVTLYRTLELFESLGIIHKLHIGWKHAYELTDAFSEHHHHISCTSCGRLDTLPHNDQLESIVGELAQATGYANITHQLEIQGLCVGCR